jgi:hypothetical protein
MRNLSYGAAAACLAVLAGLAQVGAKSEALQLSVYGAAIALPMWLLVGGIYEYYIFLGKQSFAHYRLAAVFRFIGVPLVIASIGSFSMTCGIVWFLVPEAAYAFAASSGLAVAGGLAFQAHLANWWYRADGPGSLESSDGA